MNIIYKNKLLLWSVIVLVVINLGTLSTFWLATFGEERTKENSRYRKNPMDKGILFRELNLNDEQVLFYQNEKDKHFAKIHQIRDEMDFYHRLIHEELFSENPDTLRMNNFADSIGILNARFEKANLNHFTNLKKQLNPEQCRRFQNIMDKHSKRPERAEPHKYHNNRD
jgi:Spy/CpxP family protein refolding chaperone